MNRVIRISMGVAFLLLACVLVQAQEVKRPMQDYSKVVVAPVPVPTDTSQIIYNRMRRKADRDKTLKPEVAQSKAPDTTRAKEPVLINQPRRKVSSVSGGGPK